MQQTHYDYIIAGTGCAGLSLALHIVQQPALRHKKMLLVDEASKNKNDRTWCFWEKESGLFENIVYKQWEQLWFYSDGFAKPLHIDPYRYKMIRGIDFYNYCLAELQKHPGVEFLSGRVEKIFSKEETGVLVDGNRFTAAYVFNSILLNKPSLGKKDIWLLQHFKGWTIETVQPAFDPQSATLMDFRIPQTKGTAFCYVLPFSPTKALVEYTLFTASLLQPEEYDEALQQYIGSMLKIDNYSVRETEFGVIPMTNYRFTQRQNNTVNIGTAGGQTKGSSGYTFYFIQQHSQRLAQSLATKGHPFITGTAKRFQFYDSVLLQVLAANLLQGKDVFAEMFQKNKPQNVLAFLNNASSLSTELQLIASLPTAPFFKAARQQLF